MKVFSLFLAIALMAFWGCEKELDPVEYTKYVNNPESGLVKEKTLGDIKLEAIYKPLAYVISSEVRRRDIPARDFYNREEELKNTQYVDMKLSVLNGTNDITNYLVKNDFEQQQRLHYLSFLIQDHIRLVDGIDTLPPRLCHFERTYDLGNARTFVLAFDRTPKTDQTDKTLIFDSPFFGTGPMKVRFAADDLRKIPSIKLKP